MPEIGSGVNVGADGDGDGKARNGVVIVYATFPGRDVGEAIGAELIEARLVACVNLLPGMRSVYRWEGRIEQGTEVAAILKTRRALVARVVGYLRVAHPFVNPAVVVVPTIGGSAEFLDWVVAETT